MADKTMTIAEPVLRDMRLSLEHDGTSFLLNVLCSQEAKGAELKPVNFSAAERAAWTTVLAAALREAKKVWGGYGS